MYCIFCVLLEIFVDSYFVSMYLVLTCVDNLLAVLFVSLFIVIMSCFYLVLFGMLVYCLATL